MSIQLVERAVANVITYLQTYLPAQVSAVNSQWSDSITIVTPATADYHRSELPQQSPGIPVACFVLGEQSDGVDESSSTFEAGHALTVGFAVFDPDPDTLTTKLYRYIQAAWLAFKQLDQTVGVAGMHIFWQRPYASYSSISRRAGSPSYYKEGYLNIVAQLWENA